MTFAGGKANASLATRLAREFGCQAIWNNFAIGLKSEMMVEIVEAALQRLRSLAPKEILPSANDDALKGLKFSECLPPTLAAATVQARLSDPMAISRILAEPARSAFEG